jgi:hypothetical protein
MPEGYLLDERFVNDLRDLLRYVKTNGYWFPASQKLFENFSEAQIAIKNTLTETIPQYACMEIDGAIDEDGQNYVKVKKPTTTGTLFLFNGHSAIESKGYGITQKGPVFRVKKDTGTVTKGDRWGPTAGQWYLTKGAGQFVAVGEDDIATNCFRIVNSTEGATILYRFTLNASLALGTADADILNMDGTDTTIDATVRDPLGIFSSLTTDDAGLCLLQEGKYYVIQAPCPA